MRYVLHFAIIAGVALTGCATRNTQSSTTTTVPAGPVVAATSQPNVLPIGTQLIIRTNQAIQTAQPGQTYSAEIARAVENTNGRVLVPRGAAAQLVVIDAESGGLTDTAKVALGIRSLSIDGRTYTIDSNTAQQRGREGLGANQRTAEMVGGGALLGTLIGAVAGGGSGAAIGAATGAAGGAAVQVLTRGDEIRVPAETLLTFQLEEPLRLRAS